MAKHFFLILLCFSLSVISCEQRDRLRDDSKILIGSWNWEYTDYYYDSCNGPIFPVDQITPLDAAKSYKINFLKKGQIQYLESDVVLEEFNIIFESTETVGSVTTFQIHLNGKSELDVTAIWDGTHLLYSDFPYKHTPCHIDGNFFVKE